MQKFNATITIEVSIEAEDKETAEAIAAGMIGMAMFGDHNNYLEDYTVKIEKS